VETYGDFVRREANACPDDHESAASGLSRLLDDLVDPNPDVVSSINRRRFLTFGGTSVLAAAVLAACGSSANNNSASGATTSTSVAAASNDVAILRTASSIEHVMIDTYQKILDSGLVKTTTALDAVKLFQAQHKDHSLLLDSKTTDAGGRTFTQANPVIMQTVVTPRLAQLKTELDAVQLAYDLEKVAAATCQSVTGTFQNRIYSTVLMSIGGVEAKHVSVLCHALGKPNLTTDGAFQKTDGAIAPDPNL
jgi:hypothetical protein